MFIYIYTFLYEKYFFGSLRFLDILIYSNNFLTALFCQFHRHFFSWGLGVRGRVLSV